MTFVEQFDALFAGRRDNYAKGFPRADDPLKYEWPRVAQPLTQDVLLSHLKGRFCVGIYPIVNGQVKWFAVDFDGPRDADKNLVPDAYAIALRSAKEQLAAFESAGLHCYIERSRSGSGCHVWGFLQDWMPAPTVRRAIESLLVFPAKRDGMDLLYPVQASVDGLGKGLGNLLALPFYGKGVAEGCSVFLDAVTDEPVNPRDWLEAVALNVPAIVEDIAARVPQKVGPRSNRPSGLGVVGSPTRDGLITGALKMISPYGCRFMRHAWVDRRSLGEEEWYTALGQCTYFENGRELAHAISRDYPKYSERQTNEKFDHAMQNPGRGCQYIHERFPEFACQGCPMKAPYHTAKKSIIELATESTGTMELLGDFTDDLKRVRAYNAGELRSGTSWGIPSLDELTLLRPNELTVVGGWPNMGKTWLLVDAAYMMSQTGGIPLIFSAETSRNPLRLRFLSRDSEIELQRLRGESAMKLTSRELATLERSAERLKQLPIYTDFTTLSPEGVLAQTERTLLVNGIPLDAPYVPIFDYLQFGLREPGEETREFISRASGEYKYVAKILEHPVKVFSQLRRLTEQQDNQAPAMHWLAESSGIERNADVILIMTGERMSGPWALRHLHNVKQREGEAQKVLDLILHQAYGKFTPPSSAGSGTQSVDLTGDFVVQ